MMEPEHEWIEIPELLDTAALAELIADFDSVGIEYEHRTVTTLTSLNEFAKIRRPEDLEAQSLELHAHSLYVRPEHAHGAAMILRAYFEIVDREAEVAFTGDCPACGQALVEVWACSHCRLAFRDPVDPNDLLLPFLREHGGFDQP